MFKIMKSEFYYTNLKQMHSRKLLELLLKHIAHKKNKKNQTMPQYISDDFPMLSPQTPHFTRGGATIPPTHPTPKNAACSPHQCCLEIAGKAFRTSNKKTSWVAGQPILVGLFPALWNEKLIYAICCHLLCYLYGKLI